MTAPILPRRRARRPESTLPQRREVGEPRRAGPLARVVRGVIAGLLSASLAAASHHAVNTAAPDPVVVLLSAALAVGVCVLLAGHRMGPVRLGSAVALSQGVHHLLFSLSGGNTGGVGPRFPRGAEPVPGHTHAPPGTVPGDLSSAETAHWSMLLLHLLAAVVTYLLLRHGERAWWSLVDVLGAPIRRLLAVALPRVPAPRPLDRPGRPIRHAVQDLGRALETMTPRGPPVPVL